MRIRGRAGASWRIAASLVALVWTAAALAKTDTPTIKVNKVGHPPSNLNYFEDSDYLVYHDITNRNIHSSKDGGATWKQASGIPDGKVWMLVMHEFDSKRAYAITEDLVHYKTDDKGATWTKWNSGLIASAFRDDILHFHGSDPNRIIFNGMDCAGIFCDEVALYTTDGFKNTPKLLRGNTAGCWWAKSSALFSTGQSDHDAERVLCIIRDPFSPFKEDQRLVISDSYFKVVDKKIQEWEPDLDTNRGVQGVVNVAAVKKYLLVATASLNTDEMALFVTDDTLKWHRAMFPKEHGHKVQQEAYTVLESTNYSIQIDVMTTRPSNPMGVMFTSNSNGTYFTENFEYTNRNQRGHVDFEKISGVQGVYLLNTVTNGADVAKDPKVRKNVVTKITFDDGRTFENIKAGDEKLHLHSVTELDNVGRVYSSPAPGIVMGIGNTGDHLKDFEDGSLYVSDDGGMTWWRGLEGPHKYEFGDQGSVLVAVDDSGKANIGEFSYSLNHGKKWTKVPLPNDLKIHPDILTTTQDSTSLKFMLIGGTGTPSDPTYHTISIDFDGLHERKCGPDDMEEWHARAGEDGKATCIMGHKQTYTRRKKDAECFIKEEWKDPVPKLDPCECTAKDFECDYNFAKDDKGECVRVGPLAAPDGACKNAKPDDTFEGSSGYRLIPGNSCKRSSGAQKDATKKWPCSETVNPPTKPPSNKIENSQFVFKTERDDMHAIEKHYLERGDSSSDEDETIIARGVRFNGDGTVTVDKKVWRTTDHGKKWDPILEDEHVIGILAHEYFKDFVFFTTNDKKVIYTVDRGNTFHHFTAPTERDSGSPLSFHPDKKDWLIWLGKRCDTDNGKESCIREASLSTDRGDSWTTLVRYASKCEFTGHSAYKYKDRDLKQIVCLTHKEDDLDGPKVIVTSNDFFVEDKHFHESDVKDFATMAEFIVVAAEDKKEKGLRALGSLDGNDFAEARFPPNFKVDHQNAYTVLDSSTHAVNLFVATETTEDRRYGSILKSNSNGTSYVLSISGVNCNNMYYVDFEKIPGLEGLTLVNTVANRDKPNEPKRLQTKITHNDGAEWGFLPPPDKDAEGKNYACRGPGDEKCALHLHHYTERNDKRKTFSAATAVGLMFGVGNVGPNLAPIKEADTFMTTDAGITWKSVKKGEWVWQYGDQGSLTVLVQRYGSDTKIKTKTMYYSVNAGQSFEAHDFADKEVAVMDITSLQSGGSRNFIIWYKGDKDELAAVNVDFSGLYSRPCALKENESGGADYDLWSPKHPLLDDDCLFGHVAQYRRKKPGLDCYNDKRVDHLYMVKNCSCTRRDYECDYNFELDSHSQCKLVEGLQPITREQYCAANPDADTFYEPTGFRRIPLTTCQGGLEFEKQSRKQSCFGHEDEFERKNRVSGVAVFFAVAIPVGAAGAIGWYVWRNWQSKFGQIRLGEQRGFGGGLDGDAPWVKYPVMAVAGVVAVVAALPLLAASLWRTATGAYQRVGGGGGGSWLAGRGSRRFTTRDSFARAQADYDVVDDDEGELLGEDSDEEV